MGVEPSIALFDGELIARYQLMIRSGRLPEVARIDPESPPETPPGRTVRTTVQPYCTFLITRRCGVDVIYLVPAWCRSNRKPALRCMTRWHEMHLNQGIVPVRPTRLAPLVRPLSGS